MNRLAGRIAIVTGAGRGIGRAAALLLGSEGARVGLLARSRAELEAVRDEIAAGAGHPSGPHAAPGAAAGASGPAASPRAVAVPCDVTDPASVQAALGEVEAALGPADILVNSAGDAVSAPLSRTDEELWNRMIAVNLTGTFLMIREVARGMIARGGGRIVNIASVAGLTGAPYICAYSASKHGVVGLTRALSQELARHGITVNAVCPGYVDTSLTDRSVANITAKTGKSEEQARSLLQERSPQNRMITPGEVAALVLHLASDEGRGINGQAIVLDGGGLVA